MFTFPSRLKAGLLLLGLLFFTASASAAELNEIAVESTATRTDAALRLSGDIKYRYFQLSNPERLVIDFSKVRSGLKQKPSGGIIKKVRIAPRNGSDLRVVFDLHSAAKATVTKTQSGGFSLMSVSLRPLSAAVADAPDETPSTKPLASKPAATAKPKPKLKPKPKPKAKPEVVKKEVKQRRPVRVLIDAGHGGKDSGAVGPSGTREKDVALAISKRLYKILKNSPDFAPAMSRHGDKYLKLRRRIEVARNNRADAFVSIHANSFTSRKVRGGAVYALSIGGATSEHARWLAERENSADLVGGVSIQDKENSLASVLLDLSQTATLEASIELADNVLKELGLIGPLHKKTVQQAGFLVLKSPDIPSILVETAYISNPKEERKLRDARYQQKIATAVFRGLRDFFVANPPPGTLFAQHGADYIVRRGDTLSALAQRWGTTVAAIKETNKLGGFGLEVGQQLTIP